MAAPYPTRRLLALLVAVLAVLGATAGPASARPVVEVRVDSLELGHDVSYPQCGSPLPAPSEFGIVGVDGGRPFDVNPCLAEQIAWARTLGRPSYYVNTANPGPRRSDHWPLGQRAPRSCARDAPDSTACAYDYGWNAARDSFARARAAALAVGAPPVTRSSWWLDVELSNTWLAELRGGTRASLANDVAVLQGIRDHLRRQGMRRVGVYSTAHQWRVITGGASLDRAPVWYAGVGARRSAVRHCAPAYSFTGGPVRLAQFARGGFDANVRCS